MNPKPTLNKLYLFIFISFTLLLAFNARSQEALKTENKMLYTKETYTYKIVNNHKILADVFRCPDQEIRPAIIWIHGGALIFDSRKDLSYEQLEMYLKEGYTIVSIDYRLAPESKLAEIIEDLADAYSWILSKGPGLFNIDPDRIAIVGHSAGGYLTLVAGFRFMPSPKALVVFYGYGDITGAWYSQPDSFYNQLKAVSKDQAFQSIGDTIISGVASESLGSSRFLFYLFCRQHGLWPIEVSGHDPKKESDWFHDYEPIRNITPAYPPTMLLHGEKDTDVPIQQSLLMADLFKENGVEFEFISNSNWGHAFDEDSGMDNPAVQEAFKQVKIFLKKHLK